MDEETKSRLFEPFFTKKFQGRGLGMAAVYGIVKNHKGWISVDSQYGKGTVVRIYFPAAEIQATRGEKLRIELAKGTGTILIIGDEACYRCNHGYPGEAWLSCSNGEDRG
jgi:two-component system cell cycle sensor histidine kinase/response regulator CckA